jgi:hypothetical protein
MCLRRVCVVSKFSGLQPGDEQFFPRSLFLTGAAPPDFDQGQQSSMD